MGIRNLATFVNTFDLLNNHQLCGNGDQQQHSYLLIDGKSLEAIVYSQCVARYDMFGGDHTTFARTVERLFLALKKCHLSPVAIMEGAMPEEEMEKEESSVVAERFDKILRRRHKIWKKCQHTFVKNKTTILNSEVFVAVLKQLKIPCYQTIGSAKDVIARVALDLQCPLVSEDFFIADLPHGVISAKSLINTKVCYTETDSYIECKIFHFNNLLTEFEIDNANITSQQVLQICGALFGNGDDSKRVLNKLVECYFEIGNLTGSFYGLHFQRGDYHFCE